MQIFLIKKNRLFTSILTCSIAIFFISCEEEELPIRPPNQTLLNAVLVNTNITTNRVWQKDSVYLLKGRVSVESGATLTINAGTVIKGESGTGGKRYSACYSERSKNNR